MASPAAKLTFRLLLVAAVALMLFYVGRPLYWKISATVHDIRHNKQTVSGGISQIVQEAQRQVGWFHDESDSGFSETKKSTSARRFLLGQVL
ncbi:Low-density receptor-like protein [Perilla frutescens var. hirtella]|uniref:Low-density receptor-like protein n=1 Tax=Perilla frutescens var. hirtella TaxID=608512 RepID=A0AAD4IMY6_PERFH|nr:Low-density receptor-like protein [Perilla frutescens var. hirtella]KAH6769820.1 Low-density receptor-like protein [Perilla frutescens var. hirtella]KAH6808799.1 Low-density receptor-like protein [Perilla frutescens var. frutescens]KAH6816541.1 Low-density receptor-like protein [Perilla frutescens var. frutescens]